MVLRVGVTLRLRHHTRIVLTAVAALLLPLPLLTHMSVVLQRCVFIHIEMPPLLELVLLVWLLFGACEGFRLEVGIGVHALCGTRVCVLWTFVCWDCALGLLL